MEQNDVTMLNILHIRGVTIYIGISQYMKNLYRNSYRNISRFFFLLIKLFIFHSIIVLYELQVQKMHACHMFTLIKGLHTVMYACILRDFKNAYKKNLDFYNI